MREPSIHIKEKDLGILISRVINIPIHKAHEFSREILVAAKNKSISSRTIVNTTQSNQKKASKITMSDVINAKILGRIINDHRIKAKHNGVRPITEHSREWSQLKELAALVLKFCLDFDLEYDEGANKFVKISLKSLSQKSKVGIIGKMINTFDHVVSIYESRIEMESDDDPDLTLKLFEKYKALIVRHTGIRGISFDTDEVLIYFYKMKLEAAELKVSPYTFMDAQFDQLQWTGSYPEPNQLCGQKAKQRLFKYSFEPSSKEEPEEKTNNDVVKKLISIRR